LLSVKLSSKSFVWTIAVASGILSGETFIAIKPDLIDSVFSLWELLHSASIPRLDKLKPVS
jgi:hypothetical protein